MSADRTHLLIPIHVDALIVGSNEAATSEPGTVSVALQYSRLQKGYRTGPDLREPLKKKALEKGVHLHFRLPEAVAHGDFKKEPAFPRIPNRWLVQRVYKRADTVHLKAWLVYSDKEAQDEKDKKSAVVLLVSPPAGSSGPFAYRPTGVARVIWDADKPAGSYDYRQDQERAEVELTAVTGGDAGFSAHYPACRSILGFCDDLSDLPKLATDQKLKISYLVTGWYSAVENDPWNELVSDSAGKGWTELDDRKKLEIQSWMDERGCRMDFANKVVPSGLLCHGLIEDVSLEADGSGSTTGGNPFANFGDPKAHWVDLGNTSAEALAARVAKLRAEGIKALHAYGGDLHVLEDLVTALQVGLFSHRSGAAELDAELHRQSFVAVSGGKKWEIQQSADAATPGTPPSPPTALPPLPADLQKQLDALNHLERDFGRRAGLLRDYRWELYALWHRWTDATVYGDTKLKTQLKPVIDAFRKVVLQCEGELKRSSMDRAKADLEEKLSGLSGEADANVKYALVEQSRAPFYLPKDPVLLLTGPAARPSGTKTRPDSVKVRFTREELQSFHYRRGPQPDKIFDATDVVSGISNEYLGTIPPWAARLLKEALLVKAAEAIAADGNAIEYPDPNINVLPDAFGRSLWRHNPWIPLYIHWSVLWQAQDPTSTLPHGWTLHYGEKDASQYRRNSDLIPPVKLLTPEGKKAQYTGLSFVGSPLVNLQFSRAQADNNAAPGSKSDLLKLLKQIDELLGSRRDAMISQPLGGLHDAFILRRDGDQLPPFDYSLWKDKDRKHLMYFDPIRQELGENFHTNSSPLTLSGDPPENAPPFSPLRNGVFQLAHLWVIDAFGQRTLIQPKTSETTSVSGRLSVENPLACRLHPRFCRPMRLKFTDISADVASPICGWVVQNRFDQNLVLYAASGQPVGILQKSFTANGTSLFYWVDVPGAHGSGEKQDGIQDPDLRDFARFVLSLNLEAGRAFDELINQAVDATEERMPEDNPLISVLLGRPLALVRAELRFEIDGLPALDQVQSWTELPNPGELEDLLMNSLKQSASPLPNRFMKTGEVEKVRWPVRLGDRRSSDDGLVGFFKGGPGSRTFYPAWGFDLGNQDYPGLERTQDLEMDCDTPLQVTLLMDPQARVYVTSGVLPRGSLELPSGKLNGLKQVREVFFQTAPVLGTTTTPHVPTPSDDYGQWSWAYRPSVTGWAEDPNMVSNTELAGPSIGWATLTEGWLKLKTEPVLIRSMWLKSPAGRPSKDMNVTLAWSLHGADTVELFQLRPDGTEEPQQKWIKAPLGTESTIRIEAKTIFRLRATNSAGWEDSRDLEIQIEE